MMKQIQRIFALLFTFCFLFLPVASLVVAEEPRTSGMILEGIRYVQLSPDSNNTITVYRGDYMRPHFADNKKFKIIVSALKIEKNFPASGSEENYIKFKKSGIYEFLAGEASGTIAVIDYTSPSYHELDAKGSYNLLKNTKPLILDVRTKMEYDMGHIKGAILIPVQELEQRFSVISDYQHQDVFIYCASGNRSTVASRILIRSGFKRIYNLRYGIADWINNGYSVSK